MYLPAIELIYRLLSCAPKERIGGLHFLFRQQTLRQIRHPFGRIGSIRWRGHSLCLSVCLSLSLFLNTLLDISQPQTSQSSKKRFPSFTFLSAPVFLAPGQKPHPGPLPPPPPFFPQNKSTVGSSNLDTKQILHSPESRKQTERPGKARKKKRTRYRREGRGNKITKERNDIIREKTPARTEGCEKTDQKR